MHEAEAMTLAIRPRAPKARRMRDPIEPTPEASGEKREAVGSLDLELAPTCVDQIAYLMEAGHDSREYGRRFIVSAFQIGATLHLDRRGRLIVGFPGDERVQDRQARMAQLSEHMRIAGMRYAVAGAVNQHGFYTDRRPNEPRQTTKVLRDFLNAGYRLYSFSNWVEEGGSLPLEWFTTEDQDRADEIIRAGRAYLQLRARYAARPQIERAVRMLGCRHEGSGAIVLERRS